ncbi:MAG: thioredoxin family protein [Bacteroidia bacterium]
MKKIILILILGVGFASCKSTTKTKNTTAANSISWARTATLAEAKQSATEAGKPIFVDLSTVWCGYCKKMKRNVYTNAAVAQAMNAGFIPLALDGEKSDGAELVSKLGINGFPTLLILDAQGNVLKKKTGYLDAQQLIAFLK